MASAAGSGRAAIWISRRCPTWIPPLLRNLPLWRARSLNKKRGRHHRQMTKAPAVSSRGLCPVTASKRLFRFAQGNRTDTGSDIQALAAFDAERLQVDGLIETADQHIGAGADRDGGLGRGPDIVTRQRALAQVGGGREHAPHQDAAFGIADVDAELGDRADIMLAMAIAAIGAMQVLGRAEHKAPAAGDVAGQIADPYAMGGGVGSGGKGKAGHSNSRAKHQTKCLHGFYS